MEGETRVRNRSYWQAIQVARGREDGTGRQGKEEREGEEGRRRRREEKET